MAIYEYLCTSCDKQADLRVHMADRLRPGIPCGNCGGELRWAGLSAPSVGTEQRFGVILNDGTRVKGGLHSVKRGLQAR